MLEQILDFIHNYFEVQIIEGTFKVESGKINIPLLKDGQYFKVKGSVFNDGVHKYDSELALTDEEFTGEIWALAVPPAVIKIAEEVKTWQDTYGQQANSPFQSESFGGYSYTKASASNSSGRSTPATWQTVFGPRLNAYRKIS